MKKNIILSAILVIAISITGCGKTDDSKGKTVTSGKNSMSFSSKEISGKGFILSYVEAKEHKMQTGSK